MYKFWKEAGGVARTALACAGLSILINISTYFGVGLDGPMSAALILHVITIGLGFIAQIRMFAHHSLYSTRAIEPETLLVSDKQKHLPGIMTAKPLIIPAILALAYLLITARTDGSSAGDPLRMFSSAWIFFLIVIAAEDEVIRKRIEALNALPAKEAA